MEADGSIRGLTKDGLSLGDVQSLSDPVVLFDQLTGQFVVCGLDYNQNNSGFKSRIDFAVSNDDNPLDGWTVQRYDMLPNFGRIPLDNNCRQV